MRCPNATLEIVGVVNDWPTCRSSLSTGSCTGNDSVNIDKEFDCLDKLETCTPKAETTGSDAAKKCSTHLGVRWTPPFGPFLMRAKRGLCAWVMRPDERREIVVGRSRSAVACLPAEAKAKPERRRPVHAATRGKQPWVFVLRAPCAAAFR